MLALLIMAGFFGLYTLTHQFLTIYFTKKNNTYDEFKRTWTCFNADWLFVFLNFFFVLAGPYELLKTTIIIMLGIIVSLGVHLFWQHSLKKNYFFEKNGFSTAGKLHFVFFGIETALIIIFLSSFKSGLFTILGLATLLLFNIGMFYGSYKTHGKILRSDLIGGIILFLFIILNTVISFYV